jgi:hypothetical protein
LLPALFSAALVSWLLWRIPPARLAAAAALLDWPWLAVATGLMVLGLYFWDALCVRWLFGHVGRPLRYGETLHARGKSYLLGAVNYELGQGLLAWEVARRQGIPLVKALAGCVLLAAHDLAVLLGFGLLGSFAGGGPRSRPTLVFCGAGIAGLLAFGLLGGLVRRARKTRFGGWLDVWGWWLSVRLWLLRAVYYGIILAYAAVALHLGGLAVTGWVVGGVIPLVLLADGLPISVSGLGTRETALLFLLDPAEPAVVLALSLTWSAGLMIGRLTLGLGHYWLPRWSIA